MTKQLATHVHVTDEHFQRHVFGPGDTVPDWARKKITNPKAWKSEETAEVVPDAAPETQEPNEGGGSEDGHQENGEAEVEDTGDTSSAAPPKGNASREDWATYATSRGIDVTGQMGRDDIRAAVEQLDAQQVEQPSE